MEDTITVALPEELRSELDELTRAEGVTAEKVVSQAVQEYIFFKRYRLLRDRMVPYARSQGIYTDQDVFDRFS